MNNTYFGCLEMDTAKESKGNGDNQEKKEGKETSIYQRFKMNSHKIMIDVPNEGAFTDNKKNHKLEILKKRLGKKTTLINLILYKLW